MEQTKPTPMELLKQVAPEFAQNQFEQRALLFESPQYQTVPLKYKLLAGIAVAVALGSDTCTKMWSKMAAEKGVSSSEIVEAILVARYMKMATVNDTAAGSLEILTKQAAKK
jgi:alkylhydroperoxidase/carboxymuconolactone decarboxylase family protein YurZ